MITTGLIDVGLVIPCSVKFICELVDLLAVDGKLDNVIDDDDVSLVCEKLLKLVELTTAGRKIVGNVNIIVS